MAKVGEAIYDLLITNPALLPVHEERVNAVRFAQSKAFPAFDFNTRGLKELPCRGGSPTKTGQLEIGVLANTPLELATAVETLTDELNDYEGTHLGYFIQLSLSDDEFDEDVPEINGFYKGVLFDLMTTKLN